MIRLAEKSNVRGRIGIAIENPLIVGAVSRILTGMGKYEIAVFDEKDVARGSWPEVSCHAIVTSPEAFRVRNEAHESVRCRSTAVILALKRQGLPCHREKIAIADSFVLMDETLPRLPSLVLLSRYGLSIMPRAVNGNHMIASPRLGRLQLLSAKDLQVLRELGHGEGNHAIAKALKISVPMAKVHIRRIIERLGFRNRTDAAVFGALWFSTKQWTHTQTVGREAQRG